MEEAFYMALCGRMSFLPAVGLTISRQRSENMIASASSPDKPFS